MKTLRDNTIVLFCTLLALIILIVIVGEINLIRENSQLRQEITDIKNTIESQRIIINGYRIEVEHLANLVQGTPSEQE